jgi:putative ABC transport system permease protein
VVASLALSVALTVMVGSFRDSVTRWLDVLLPAPLYLRGPAGAGPGFDPARLATLAALPGIERIDGLRLLPLQLDPARPPVALIARPLRDAARELPLLAPPLPAPAGTVPVYASEAFVALYGAVPGQPLPRLAQAFGGRAQFFVAGVWRDYARQQGSLVLPAQALERLTGEARFDDLAVHLQAGADANKVAATLRQALDGPVEITSAEGVRALSLRIFDRSFAVTYWLQAVAIGIGLFGVAASFGAQVLARRREFGLLAHLGLTPAQVRRLVAGEGLVWTALGTLAGLALGLGVSVLLVHVVNPQSFHWTMELSLPWPRLLALCAAVLACGTVTAWLAARAVAGADVVRAVREDW